jgi:hypothetical protein
MPLMPGSDSSALFEAELRRFQQRFRLALFVRLLPVACAIALVAIAVMLAFSRQYGISTRLLSGSLLFATAAASAIAVVRTPSLAETARMVDRELRLQDRATSALQFAQAADPISRLLVTEATARLQQVPVSRLPLAVPQTRWWVASSATMFSGLLLMTLTMSPAPARDGSPVSGTTTTGDARPGHVHSTHGTAANPGPSTGGPAPAPAPDVASAAQRDSADGKQAAANSPDADAARGRNSGGDRTPPVPPSAGAGDGPSPTAHSSGHAAAAGTGQTTNAGGADESVSGNTRSALSGSGRGARALGGRDTRAGGIGEAAVVDGRSGSRAFGSRFAAERQTAAYAAAYARAESATPAERVPAPLRSYVRAYFLAIRPGPNQ